ncbi:MAG: hypothetical protein ACOYD1_07965 [Candidatus Nanopelagicales bacterium]
MSYATRPGRPSAGRVALALALAVLAVIVCLVAVPLVVLASVGVLG